MERKDQNKPKNDLTTMSISRAEQAFPESLTEWAPQSVLVSLTLEAIERCEDRAGMGGRWPVAAYDGFQFKTLLALVTYGYAVGLCGSWEIQGQLRRDSGLSYLSAGSGPTWNVMMRFRQENKEAIVRCLEYLAKLAWAFRFEQSEWDSVDWAVCEAITFHDWFTPEWTARGEEFARQRVLWATQSDSAFLDA